MQSGDLLGLLRLLSGPQPFTLNTNPTTIFPPSEKRWGGSLPTLILSWVMWEQVPSPLCFPFPYL